MLPVILAQAQQISGNVSDDKGPLVGVSVYEKNLSTNGTSTDNNGHFILTLKQEKVLVFKLVGYLTKEVSITPNQKTINITMAEDTKGLEEIVVLGYGTQKKLTNTGSVSSITNKDLKQNPTTNLQNSLQGRLPGFFAVQRSGQPGLDASQFFIRGVSSYVGVTAANGTTSSVAGTTSLGSSNNALIIVDDIEYNMSDVQRLDPNEIESISILKDAATTAIYGLRGANGVLVITTKRGQTGKPSINLRQEFALQTWSYRPKFLRSYENASLLTEAEKNSGMTTTTFTPQDLELFRTGADPYGHPDVDWWGTLTRKSAPQYRTNIDISGGSNTVKYFISGGYISQDGMFKNFGQESGYNSAFWYNRYNFRSNLDIQANKNLSFRVDVNGRFGTTNRPLNRGTIYDGLLMTELFILAPYAYPIYNPNGTYGENKATNSSQNIVAKLATNGYSRDYANDLNAVFGATQKLDFLTKGLSAKANISYASSQSNNRTLSRSSFPSYYYNSADGSYRLATANLYRLPPPSLSTSTGLALKVLQIQGILNYDNTFKDHRAYGTVLIDQKSDVGRDGTNLPWVYRRYTGRFGYNYKQKYLVEFIGGYNGSDRFQTSKRYGFFPAASVAWNIAEEKFFQKALPFVDVFKLRASRGLTGNDGVAGNFGYVYQQTYTTGNGTQFGQTPGTNFNGVTEGRLANLDVTWEKDLQTNFGVDLNMFKNKLNIVADRFYGKRYDILTNRSSISGIFGASLPPVNLGIVERNGWDGEITYKNQLKDFGYSVNLTYSFSKNKIIEKDEAQPRYPWLAETGHSIGQNFGYLFNGFYSAADIADPNVAKPSITPRPGDLKYLDINGDKVIDAYDRRAIGSPSLPSNVIGLNLNFNYKGFGLALAFQGSYNFSIALNSEGLGFSNYQPLQLLRWTPETAATAQYPALGGTSINDARTFFSDFWLLEAWYVRLRTAEFSYQLPDSWIKPVGLKGVRVYTNGNMLFTKTNVNKKYQVDPESIGGANTGYPAQRTFNLGVNVTF
ncbi:SusC/RagA family TonB-linked outer membrane protein [Pedobacter sp. ASV12]|uniref:SusC/RagA family TonB-linked outer membrane protein n=1 Tax=Pedobacter sp. ASV12 TaxID=2795120 RepID=UPI0018EB141F|nr:TonB-dependent receptor [Pedobacter sp. ASV12]